MNFKRFSIRTWRVVILSGIVLVLAVVWFGVKESEPTYQGQPLSWWIEELETKPGSEEYYKAKDALVHIGSVPMRT